MNDVVKPFQKDQPTIAECWRWIKGLLYDFINLKKTNVKLESAVEKSNLLKRELNLQISKLKSIDGSRSRAQKSARIPP